MPNPYGHAGQLPPQPADPKAMEEAKKKVEAQKNLNAERIAAIALGQDPNKAVAAAKAQPTLVTQEKAAADQAAERALKSAETRSSGRDEEEDEDF
jgi:hypothetical protein